MGEAGLLTGATPVRARFSPSASGESEETRGFLACHRIALAELPSHRLRALLLAAEGDPVRALDIPDAVLRTAAIALTEKQIARLGESRTSDLDPRLLERAVTTGTYALLYGDPLYPQNLLPLTDAPPLLFVRGELLPDDRFGIAIVGTRRSSDYGATQAARFAGVFAVNGLTVISGGASGIDAAAHDGALRAGGRTVAVLGCGVDIIYPSANRDLFARIVASGSGALVSEFGLGTRPEPWRFPTRNRIIAGLSRASVLIETPENSGALGTAKCAAEYGRDVYVVPGPVDSGRSRGGHRLIGDGAILADAPEDVLSSLGVVLAAQEEKEVVPMPRSRALDEVSPLPDPLRGIRTVSALPEGLSPEERAFVIAVGPEPRPFDAITLEAELNPSQANVAATLLEMKNLIRRHPGNLFSRV